ncbi:MAG TPA: hypothetical protein VFD10_00585 [Atribacterota bacterium]|nr:hypothetical protein [Atribacterota bacterium]
MLFSQRKGIRPVKNVLQIDSIDVDLRNGVWNVLIECYWDSVNPKFSIKNTPMDFFIKSSYSDYFKRPLDTLGDNWEVIYAEIREYYFSCQWYEIYDFIEFIANNYPLKYRNDTFMSKCNYILEKELSAYRFVGGKITQITSQEEISEIEEALNISKPFETVSVHINRALALFSDKKSPDYRNSIKESISAVEAICKLIVKKGNPDLGQALKIMENEIGLHPALKKAFNNLYGYTSDDKGIRHALLEEAELYPEDAKFMLISCSAFVNYLVSKISKIEIKRGIS